MLTDGHPESADQLSIAGDAAPDPPDPIIENDGAPINTERPQVASFAEETFATSLPPESDAENTPATASPPPEYQPEPLPPESRTATVASAVGAISTTKEAKTMDAAAGQDDAAPTKEPITEDAPELRSVAKGEPPEQPPVPPEQAPTPETPEAPSDSRAQVPPPEEEPPATEAGDASGGAPPRGPADPPEASDSSPEDDAHPEQDDGVPVPEYPFLDDVRELFGGNTAFLPMRVNKPVEGGKSVYIPQINFVFTQGGRLETVAAVREFHKGADIIVCPPHLVAMVRSPEDRAKLRPLENPKGSLTRYHEWAAGHAMRFAQRAIAPLDELRDRAVELIRYTATADAEREQSYAKQLEELNSQVSGLRVGVLADTAVSKMADKFPDNRVIAQSKFVVSYGTEGAVLTSPLAQAVQFLRDVPTHERPSRVDLGDYPNRVVIESAFTTFSPPEPANPGTLSRAQIAAARLSPEEADEVIQRMEEIRGKYNNNPIGRIKARKEMRALTEEYLQRIPT
jgi:hypothetical protein